MVQPLAGRREWIGLAALALPTLLISMDSTVLFLAIPAISTGLKPSDTQLLWITDIFGFVEAGLLITMGTLGDRIGRRRLLITGALAFAAASVLAAFSSSPGMLIVSRAVLGVTGATLLPSTLSLLRNMFHDDRQRTFAMGIWTTCFSTGTMLGPLVGGLILSHFWWGAVFLMGIPVMLLFLVLGPLYLPEFKHPDKMRMDLPSVGLLVTSSLALIYGIKQVAAEGVAASPVLSMAAGLGLALLFVRRQLRLPHPLIDPGLFRRAALCVTLLAILVALFTWDGLFYFVGQYFQLVLDMSPARAGIWTVPSALGSILGCMLAPQAVRKIPRPYVIGAGMVLTALGAFLFIPVSLSSGPVLLAAATVLLSAGCGITVTLGSDLIVSTAPSGKAGAAAGIYETSATFGASLGVAILGSVGVTVYRGALGPALRPGTSTLGSARALALNMHNAGGENLLGQARRAFLASMHTSALAAGLLLLVAAGVVVNVLRRSGDKPQFR